MSEPSLSDADFKNEMAGLSLTVRPNKISICNFSADTNWEKFAIFLQFFGLHITTYNKFIPE